MIIRRPQDFYAGLLFIAVGASFAVGAGSYPIGTASDMGPGYFPRLVGILGAIIGLAVLAKAVLTKKDEDEPIGPWAWKPLSCIIVANLLFGAMIGGLPSIGLPPMGLFPAVFVLVFLSSLAGQEFQLKEVFVVATILAVGVWAICVKLLNLYVPLWPPFFGA